MNNAPILTEDTRFNLKFNNLWAIGVMLVILTLAFSQFNSRLDRMDDKQNVIIANQTELKAEFKDWKTQAETRLGTVESKQNQVVTLLNQHLSVNIK